ncbi:hypothetical protein [Lelliottia wanjuensis]|uniref:hypothetical protein n=1 Tax=Lelliottia wanjuensis TaxID=3050585 RepID=UPI00254E0E9E|nr:hypothetical protein [Lelliottia sp. V86_10]MDK9583184.1 hypothetical protein [Lelliottia sp. V86_10]
MTKSLLPPGLKIRVLTTIENGEVTQEVVSDDRMVLSVADFITVAHRAGLLVSRKVVNSSLSSVFARIEMVQKIISEGLENLNGLEGIDITATLCELHEEIMDIESQLKELSPGE